MTDKPKYNDWKALADKESRGKALSRETPEHIHLKNVYGPEDAAGIDSGLPGLPPYTRGPYATMYAGRPWTISAASPRPGVAGCSCSHRRCTAGTCGSL